MEVQRAATKAASAKRRRNQTLRVCVDSVEAEIIKGHARLAGMSASNYLRALGLGYQPESVVDHEAVITLAHIAGDQGRLGGLLKLWLSARPGEGASEHDVSVLLRQIQELQAQLTAKILAL